jgi:hypothetical protein
LQLRKLARCILAALNRSQSWLFYAQPLTAETITEAAVAEVEAVEAVAETITEAAVAAVAMYPRRQQITAEAVMAVAPAVLDPWYIA